MFRTVGDQPPLVESVLPHEALHAGVAAQSLLGEAGPASGDGQLYSVGGVQLVEQVRHVALHGRLAHVQAGRDVGVYLTEFQIPETFPEPVTLRTLMNHTAGFEDHVIGTGARTADDVLPLGEYLEKDVRARTRPPGHVSGYSNYGAALAGHIVAEVSGEPYDQYIRAHVLDPLGMTHCTAAEPVPAWLAHDLATSYNSETSTAVPFTFDMMAPDGAIRASASDMARFMAAHLDDHGGGILPAQTMDRMHERTFAAHPRQSGYAHGFMDRTMNGHRVLMHDGSWEGFLSALILLPDCDLGLFVSANATGGIDAISEIVPAFLDRFAPETGESAHRSSGPASPLSVTEPRAGFYKPARHNESDVEKQVTLLGPSRLQVAEDDTVRFRARTGHRRATASSPRPMATRRCSSWPGPTDRSTPPPTVRPSSSCQPARRCRSTSAPAPSSRSPPSPRWQCRCPGCASGNDPYPPGGSPAR